MELAYQVFSNLINYSVHARFISNYIFQVLIKVYPLVLHSDYYKHFLAQIQSNRS